MAHLAGMTALQSVYFRCKRLAYANLGLHWSLLGYLHSETHSARTMNKFESDFLLWEEFSAHAAAPGGVPDAVTNKAKALSFNKTSVKQFVAAAKEYKWVCKGDFAEKLRTRARLAGQSALVEETIGDIKDRATPRHTTLFRRPVTCYYMALRGGSLAKRSQWDTPSADAPLESKMSRLPNDAFSGGRPSRLRAHVHVQL